MPRLNACCFLAGLFIIMNLLLVSCTKTEEVYVPDNAIPPDLAISAVKVKKLCLILILVYCTAKGSRKAGKQESNSMAKIFSNQQQR
jgi:hypothetical protein